MACLHRRSLHTSICRHRRCLVASYLAFAHRPTAGDIGQGLHASTMACAHRVDDIDCGMRASARRRRPTVVCITKAYMHLTWHVRIRQETSDNGKWHKPRPARIGRGMCGSGKRSRQSAGSICQGLHTSVGRHRQATSDNGLYASAWLVLFRPSTTANGGRLQPRPACISHGVCVSAVRHQHQPITGSINPILYASDVACTRRSADVGRGLPTLSIACTHRSADVEHGLDIS